MNNPYRSLAASAGLLLVLCGSAYAVSLSFSPSAQRGLEIGGPVSADLVVSGLNPAGAPSLGGFSVQVEFDEAVLDFSSASFGSGLGAIVSDDPFVFTADAYGEVTQGTGFVSLLESSYIIDFAELDALQSDSFVLATLNFEVAAAGYTALSFGDVELTNAFGNAIADPELTNGLIPSPATLGLVIPALGLLGWLRRRRGERAVA